VAGFDDNGGVPAEVVIRPPVVDDADDIGRIHVVAWQIGYQGLMAEATLNGLDASERGEYWRELLFEQVRDDPRHGPVPLVAERDGAVVGVAVCGPFRPGVDDSAEHRPAGELWMLNVDPEHWGTGIAQQLDNHAVDQLRLSFPGEMAALWVLEANARGRRFYEKQGWRADGQSKDENVAGAVLTEVRYFIEL